MRTEIFERVTELPWSAAEVFEWHARPGALERLTPPFQQVELVERQGSIEEGDRTVLKVGPGPFARRWVAEHRDTVEGKRFRDVQVEGPFAHWVHTHEFEDRDGGSILRDRIEWAPPGGALGRLFGGSIVETTLERTFRYRHQVLVRDLELHGAWRDRPRRTVAISGASGLVGSSLTAFLETGGHRVLRLVRRPARNDDEVHWQPYEGVVDLDRLEGIDAVVHLAGENIAGGRWTEERRRRIRDSRTEATRKLVRSLGELERPPAALLCASAIGYYGSDAGPDRDEGSPPGDDFLARVCVEWEDAARGAEALGCRVAQMRFGVVLSPADGALAKMLPAFKAGGGGPLGGGDQLFSWVALDDVVATVHRLLMDDDLQGAFNVVAPQIVRQKEFANTLGRVLHRPAFLPLPAFALRTLFGEMADATLMADIGAPPRRLEEHDFEPGYPRLEGALAHLLGRERP